MAKTLQTNRPYVLPGTYIGEDIQPGSVNVAPETRVPTYVGKGSSYRLVKNSGLVRGYIYDAPLEFTASSPWTSQLPTVATGNKDTAVLVDAGGIEVLKDQWRFNADKTAVIVSDSAYNPASTYALSYQGNDANVPDAVPVPDLRLLTAIGTQQDQNQYKRNIDFAIDVVTEAPVPTVDADGVVIHHTNSDFAFSGLTHVGTGLGGVALDPYATFEHKYTRGYRLTVVSVSGTQVTFSWSATPLATGNASLPAVPLVPSLPAPQLVVDSANPQTLVIALELGIRLNIDFGPGAFVVGDTYSFVAMGPSMLENASAQLNTNQFAETSQVVASLDNTGVGGLTANGDEFSGSANVTFKAQVTAVDSGTVSGTLPDAHLVFGSAPIDGAWLRVSNGRAGAAKAQATFEFDNDSIQTVVGSTLVTEPVTPAVAATGVIDFVGAPTSVPDDGTTITIEDGVRTVAFEFDSDALLSNPGATRVLVGANSAETAANLATAISSSSLRITATDVTASNGGLGRLTLVNQVAGVQGNAAIVVSGAGVTATGMTGGIDAVSELAGTITNFVSTFNAADLGIIAVVDSSDSSKVNLRHGARLQVPSNPVDGTTFAVSVGGVSKTFTFKTTAVDPTDIAIDASATLTIAAAATVVSGQLPVLVRPSAYSLVVAPTTARNVTILSSLAVVPSVIDDANAENNGNVAIVTGSLAGVTVTGFSGGADATTSPDRVTVAWATSGDAFASGTAVLQDGVLSTLYRGVKIGLSRPAAAAAVASVILSANPADGSTVVVPDGILPTGKTFEFDNNSAVVAGRTAVAIGPTAAATAANLAAAIATSGLQLTASVSGSSVSLTHKKNGAGPDNAYNTPVTSTGAGITVIGFAGGRSNYAVGDTFTFVAKAPRQVSLALDDRITHLTVTQSGSQSDAGFVSFTYEANTPEGGFGELAATTANGGYISLPGQIQLVVRNASRFTVGDRFTVEHVNNGQIIWSLNAKANQTFAQADVHTDRNGSVTGKFGALYITLGNVPLDGTLNVTLGGLPFTAYRQVAGSSILVLNTTDVTTVAAGLAVAYVYRGNEPAIGSTYYVSGQYKRPASYYNTPFLFTGLEEALAFLAPVTADNDLAIAAMLAFGQNQSPLAISVVQVRDADEDGAFSDADIDAALAGAKDAVYTTDLAPLRLQKYLSKFLAHNVGSCDPFEKREQMFYYGAAAGTPIGDVDTTGSLISIAKSTLQVFGPSYAHGTRVMVAPRTAKKTITLSDNTTLQVTLDGSFVAGAVAACVAGMPTYSQTLLKTQLLGFDSIETFGNSQNLLLGAAGLIFFSDSGSGVYVFEEDQTVDKYDAEFSEILPMRTKQDVTRIVRREMDKSVIGMVPNTRGDAKATIASKLMQVLIGLVNTGVIPPYQDDAGNARQINSSDVEVFVDSTDPTKYNFLYGFFTRFAIKRLFGLYVTNKTVKG